MQNQKMMKQLQQMQAQMAQIQEDLGQEEVTGSAGGGVVTCVATGHQKVLSVTIAPEVLEEGSEMVADLVVAAVNDALDKSRDHAGARMGQLTAKMGLPPGMF